MSRINSSTIKRKVFQKLELNVLGKADFIAISTCLSSIKEYPDNLNLGGLQCTVNFIYFVLSKYSKYSWSTRALDQGWESGFWFRHYHLGNHFLATWEYPHCLYFGENKNSIMYVKMHCKP